MTKLFMIHWNPYPGQFWVSSKPEPLRDESQIKHFKRRGLAFDSFDAAIDRIVVLNDALAPLLGALIEASDDKA